ncbi:uncharacterized protein ZBAI_09557 [Zygosaccharomyces bailii ISA1307]|nr:uncharacterized protein ZBAI_09557 [Zygosaccharomyces bailii ISA1307]
MVEINLSYFLGKQVTAPVLVWLLWRLFKEYQNKENVKAIKEHNVEQTSDSVNEKLQDWKPTKFIKEETIPIQVEEKENYKSWEETERHPYKPFKPGEHHLAMNANIAPISYWIVMDKSYKDRIMRKWEILETEYEDLVFHLDPVMINSGSVNSSPEEGMNAKIIITEQDARHADEALCEFYKNLVSYLTCRFPQYFQVVLEPGATPGALYNKILDEYHPVDPVRYLKLSSEPAPCINYKCFNTDIIPDKLTQDLDIMEDEIGYRVLISCDKTRRAHELILAGSRLAEDDLTLLSTNASNQYNGEAIMHSGIFAFASGFNSRHKFLKPLTLVHAPVPGYEKDLQSPMNKFLARLKPNTLVYRVNYAFQKHAKLYSQRRIASQKERAADEERGRDKVHYRSERQTLIKFETLEGRNTVVFGIKTYLWNFEEEFLTNNFYSQPEIVEELRQAVVGIDGAFGKYKAKSEWGPPLMELIDRAQKLNKTG